MSTQQKSTVQKAHNTRSASVNSQEEKEMSIPKPIDEKDFKKLDTDRKLDKMANALNKLAAGIETKLEGLSKQIEEKIDPVWEAIFHTEDGLQNKVTKIEQDMYEDDLGMKAKIQALEQSANFHDQMMSTLQAENAQLRRELETFKGIAQRQQEQVNMVKDDIVYLSTKSMAKNITISGLKEEKDESCKTVVIDFLNHVLRAPITEDCEIKIAHRLGIPNPANDNPRLMVVKCTSALKSIAMDAFKAFKEAQEREGNTPLKYYVNEQLPDKLMEKRKEIRHYVWEQRNRDHHLPKEQKASIKIQNDVVYVNKQPIKHKLPPIKMNEMFPDPEQKGKLDEVVLIKSDDKTVKGSVFQAFAMQANSVPDAHLAQLKVRVTNPSVSHVIAAFVTGDGNYAFDDDGEHGAGLRLVRAVQNAGFTDVVVVVARRFGGKHIGAQRFQVINELAIQAIQRLY